MIKRSGKPLQPQRSTPAGRSCRRTWGLLKNHYSAVNYIVVAIFGISVARKTEIRCKNLALDVVYCFQFFLDFLFASFFFYFFLEKKVTKIQGLIKIGCASKPEVSSRNTRHETVEKIKAFVVAVYSCPLQAGLHTCLRTYLRQEPLSYFS